ncbi:MAG: hypothetical protein LBT27_05210, partial [Prevotellaceae bacterium]|nr:hypothetical protein [Prevotellaceae bacterium]
MKKLLLIIFILLNAAALQAIYVENYPVTLEQPDGTKVSCFLSGDEYYNWVHDANGYSLIRDAQGYIVYAKLENDELVATSYRAGSVDPSAVGLQPNQIISDAKRTLLRSNFLQRTAAAKNAAGLQD